MDDPKNLGKYNIQSTLGQGAMGIVYKGFDPHIERTVAIKTVRKDAFDPKDLEPLLARFKREAQAAGRLTHPSIVTVYEYGEEENSAYIAMEYVQGRELKEFLDNNERFSFETTIDFTNQLLGALAYSHNQGVVHRDIKPGNILVLEDGHIKITDFGIARIESSNLTQFGDVMGTPSYMSPEQFMGQQVDKRSDIFSAGVILYHLLTGEKPFPGNSMATIMHRVMNTEPPRVSELNFQIPPNFDSIIFKALAKNPDQRFQTAEEFSAALNNAGLSGEAASATGRLTHVPVTKDEATVQLPVENDQIFRKREPGTQAMLYRKGRFWALTFLVLFILTLSSLLVWKIYSDHLSADDLKLMVVEKYSDIISLVTGKNQNTQVQEIFKSSKRKPVADTRKTVPKKTNNTAPIVTKQVAKPIAKVQPAQQVQPKTPPPEMQQQSAKPPTMVQPTAQPASQAAASPAADTNLKAMPEQEKEYAPFVKRPAPGRMLKESEW